jgi:hypothetical protein
MDLIQFIWWLYAGAEPVTPVPRLSPPVSPPRRAAALNPAPRAQYVGLRVAVPGSSACQVCGDPLKGGLVACPACATLSHEVCWEYARGCATYGCDVRG